jgi:hypothetical protein
LAGRDFTAAEKTVTQMLALRPDDAEALERRQSIHAELEAARLTAAADRQRQEGEFDPLKTRLMSELAGGDFAAAEKTVSRMLTLRPKDPESLHHLRTIRTELEAARRAAAAEAARVKAKIERQRRGAEFEALRTKMSDEVARRDFAAAEKTAARLLGLKPNDPDVLDRQRKIRTEIESAHLAAVARAMDQTTREAGPFVQIHQAGWTHADWQRFLERLRVSVPESILSDTEVGKLLDQEAARLRERPGAESARQAAERDAARGREEDGNFDLLRERLTSEVIRKDFATARQTAAAMIRLRPKDREAIHLQKSVERALAADGSPGVRWRKSTEVLPPRFLPAAAIERLAASPKSALALSILAAFETAISAAIITERLGKSSAGDESAAGMSVVTLVLLTAVSIYLAASGRLRHPRVLETVILASAVASLVLLIAMMIAAS